MRQALSGRLQRYWKLGFEETMEVFVCHPEAWALFQSPVRSRCGAMEGEGPGGAEGRGRPAIRWSGEESQGLRA